MIVQAHIQSWQDAWSKMTAEQYATLRLAIPDLPAERPEYPADVLVDEIGIRALAAAGLAVELKPGAEGTMLVKLQDRIKALELRSSHGDDATIAAAGAMVQIHIPGMPLMLIDEVEVLDDCCTVELQRYLKDGWRILAVCPPNAQRRPDYVIGRRKEV